VTALVASLLLALSTPATISVDGQRIATDVAPVTTADGHAYLPLRAISDAAGAQATFDPANGSVALRRGTDVLVLRPGHIRAVLNGHTKMLAHAPFLVRGRLMVSSALVASTFGSTVRFDPRRGRISVRNPGVVVAGAADDEP